MEELFKELSALPQVESIALGGSRAGSDLDAFAKEISEVVYWHGNTKQEY